MSDYAYRPGGSDRGTSRETALRPALGFRLALLVILAVFIGEFARGLGTAPGAVSFAVLAPAVLCLGTLYAALRAFTARVWVEHSFEPGSTMSHQLTLNQTRFGQHTKAYLRSPNKLRISAPAPFGARPQWRLTVIPSAATSKFSVSAPWVTDLPRLLELLYPIALGDPALVADDETRALLDAAAPTGNDSFDPRRGVWWFPGRGDDTPS